MTRRKVALAVAAVVLIGGTPAVAAPAAVACTVTYQVTNEWNNGFGAAVSIRNDGEALLCKARIILKLLFLHYCSNCLMVVL